MSEARRAGPGERAVNIPQQQNRYHRPCLAATKTPLLLPPLLLLSASAAELPGGIIRTPGQEPEKKVREKRGKRPRQSDAERAY